MKKFTIFSLFTAAVFVAGASRLNAQQPAPRQPAPAQAPPFAEPQPRVRGPGFMGGIPGFAVVMFDPTRLLERRDLLVLTADQVTRLSGLETELRAAREKSQNDAKPHREELQKLLQQSAPDAAQVRTHAQALMQAEQGAQLSTLTTAVQAKAVLTAEQRGRVQGWAEGGRVMGSRRVGPRPGVGGPVDPPPAVRMRRFRNI